MFLLGAGQKIVSRKCKNTTYVTILRGPQKCENKMCSKDNKNKKKKNNNNKKHKHTTKRCATSCGMKGTSAYCALHLRAHAEHMNNTNAHTTIRNPYDLWHRRCAKLYNIYIILHHFSFPFLRRLNILGWVLICQNLLGLGGANSPGFCDFVAFGDAAILLP